MIHAQKDNEIDHSKNGDYLNCKVCRIWRLRKASAPSHIKINGRYEQHVHHVFMGNVRNDNSFLIDSSCHIIDSLQNAEIA